MKELEIKDFSGAREWRDKFNFLEKNGLDHLYLFILEMATSKRELARLHNSLAPNLKLLRHHFIDLERFWEEHFKGGGLIRSKNKLNDVYFQWLVSHLSKDKNNTHYYLDHLFSKGLPCGRNELISDSNVVLVSNKDGCTVYEAKYFMFGIFQASFDLECWASKDGIVVIFHIDQDFLTEELTYQLSQLPEYHICAVGTGKHGMKINMAYIFLSEDFLKSLESFGPQDYAGYHWFKVSRDFAPKLGEKLRSMGIPVEGLKIKEKV